LSCFACFGYCTIFQKWTIDTGTQKRTAGGRTLNRVKNLERMPFPMRANHESTIITAMNEIDWSKMFA